MHLRRAFCDGKMTGSTSMVRKGSSVRVRYSASHSGGSKAPQSPSGAGNHHGYPVTAMYFARRTVTRFTDWAMTVLPAFACVVSVHLPAPRRMRQV